MNSYFSIQRTFRSCFKRVDRGSWPPRRGSGFAPPPAPPSRIRYPLFTWSECNRKSLFFFEGGAGGGAKPLRLRRGAQPPSCLHVWNMNKVYMMSKNTIST